MAIAPYGRRWKAEELKDIGHRRVGRFLSAECVGAVVSNRMKRDLAIRALSMAIGFSDGALNSTIRTAC